MVLNNLIRPRQAWHMEYAGASGESDSTVEPVIGRQWRQLDRVCRFSVAVDQLRIAVGSIRLP